MNDKLEHHELKSTTESELNNDSQDKLFEAEEGTIEKRPFPKWKVFFAILLIGFMGNVVYSMEDDVWLQDLEQGAYSDGLTKLMDQAISNLGLDSDKMGASEALMKDFQATLPLLRSQGFYMSDLEVGIGVPPMIVPHFYHKPSPNLDLESSMGSFKGNTIAVVLLKLLQEANALQLTLSTESLSFNAIEIELGPMPYLKVQHVSPMSVPE